MTERLIKIEVFYHLVQVRRMVDDLEIDEDDDVDIVSKPPHEEYDCCLST